MSDGPGRFSSVDGVGEVAVMLAAVSPPSSSCCCGRSPGGAVCAFDGGGRFPPAGGEAGKGVAMPAAVVDGYVRQRCKYTHNSDEVSRLISPASSISIISRSLRGSQF